MPNLIEVSDLRIAYGPRMAVDGLSFQMKQGESLGLLGVNGAGKSSTLKALLGMVPVKHGSISIMGTRPGKGVFFSKLGVAPEEATPPEYLSGAEYLGFVAKLRTGSSAGAAELLQWFELEPGKRIRDYSKGMRRRLVLAQAFVGNPELLVLDEPLNGLDPLLIIKLRDLLLQTRSRGASIIYSSHILSEVERCCSRVIILDRGKAVCDSSVEALVSEFGSVETAFAKKVVAVGT